MANPLEFLKSKGKGLHFLAKATFLMKLLKFNLESLDNQLFDM